MISIQLDLFGVPPKPPRKILSEDTPEEKKAKAAATALAAAEKLLPVAPELFPAEPPPTPPLAALPSHDVEEVAIKTAEAPVILHRKAAAPAHTIDAVAFLHIPPDDELFKRQYYSMRETSAMFDLPQPMLRHWENEFDILQPKKNKKGDRHFRPADIKNLQLIYHLLKVKKFTIEGAKDYLRNHNKALDTFELTDRLEKLKLFLLELKSHL